MQRFGLGTEAEVTQVERGQADWVADDVPSDRRLAIRMRLQVCDEREGIHDAWQVRPGDSQWLRTAETDTDEYGIIIRE